MVASADLSEHETATFSSELVAHIIGAGTTIRMDPDDVAYEVQHFETSISYNIMANVTLGEAMLYAAALSEQATWSGFLNLTVRQCLCLVFPLPS